MRDKVLHHVCIQTNQYEDSLRFYMDILGFRLEKETPNFHGRRYNSWLSLGDFLIELQTPKNEEVFNKFNTKNEGIVHICFYVTDINNEYERIRTFGWKNFILKNGDEIYSVGEGKLFKIVAPEGTIIEMRDNQGI